MRRVYVYIDGWNVLCAIKRSLKWYHPTMIAAQLVGVMRERSHERQLVRDERLSAVKYFTSFPNWPGRSGSIARGEQVAHVKALQAIGMEYFSERLPPRTGLDLTTVIRGEFKRKTTRCRGTCGSIFRPYTEKETDVNIAAELVADCVKQRFERAIVVSSDSDLKGAIAVARREVPNVDINVIAPPGRMGIGRDLSPIFELRDHHFKLAQLPDVVRDDAGRVITERPTTWRDEPLL
jgi:hypothetical protein